jgi:hypothetical protein
MIVLLRGATVATPTASAQASAHIAARCFDILVLSASSLEKGPERAMSLACQIAAPVTPKLKHSNIGSAWRVYARVRAVNIPEMKTVSTVACAWHNHVESIRCST